MQLELTFRAFSLLLIVLQGWVFPKQNLAVEEVGEGEIGLVM
jgi:hypothetical protein